MEDLEYYSSPGPEPHQLASETRAPRHLSRYFILLLCFFFSLIHIRARTKTSLSFAPWPRHVNMSKRQNGDRGRPEEGWANHNSVCRLVFDRLAHFGNGISAPNLSCFVFCVLSFFFQNRQIIPDHLCLITKPNFIHIVYYPCFSFFNSPILPCGAT